MACCAGIVRSCWGGLALTLVLGCSATDSGNDSTRSNVHEVRRGDQWSDDRCTSDDSQFCLSGGHSLSIASVRALGDRFAVVVLDRGAHLMLALSEDRGKRWHTVEIDDSDTTRGGPMYAAGVDVLLADSGTWLYVPRSEGMGKQSHQHGYLYSVDTTVDWYTLPAETAAVPATPPVDFRANHALFIVPESSPNLAPHDARSAQDVALRVTEVDPADRSRDVERVVRCDRPECSALHAGAFQGSDDGDHYLAFSSTEPGGGSECIISYSRSSASIESRCVPLSRWPAAAAYREPAALPYVDQYAPELRLFDAGDHAWAVTVLPANGDAAPSASSPIDLGAGAFAPNGSFSGRPRYGGMGIVETTAQGTTSSQTPRAEHSGRITHLVRVTADGQAQHVLIPRSPCIDAATCGDRQPALQQRYGQVAWAEPLGGNEYLVLYLSDVEPSLSKYRPVISASIERARLQDVPATPFPEQAGPNGNPGAIETAGVSRQCVRALSCLGGKGGADDDILTCIDFWMTSSLGSAAQHGAALADFLALPAACNSFTNDPSTGFANVLQPTTSPEEECHAKARCTGNVWSSCDRTRDCSLVNLSCTLRSDTIVQGCELPRAIPATASCDYLHPIRCDGDYLLTCLGGQLSWTDCVDLGFASCGKVGQSNVQRCLP